MKAIWVSAALLAVIPCFGQTAAELLQKGVYAQETEGNLDNAILIYRQIVNSAPSQRDVAAQAQYRLAQALLQKGNLTEASREFERLARDYADYGSLVSSLAGQVRPGEFRFNVAAQASSAIERERRLVDLQATLAELRARSSAPDDPEVKKVEARIQDVQKALAQAPRVDLFSGEFDMTKTTLFTGKVSQVEWVNPRAWLIVETSDGTYRVQLAAPKAMAGSGVTRDTFQLGMEVTVSGALAKNGAMAVQAATILSAGTPIFNRASLAPVPNAE